MYKSMYIHKYHYHALGQSIAQTILTFSNYIYFGWDRDFKGIKSLSCIKYLVIDVSWSRAVGVGEYLVSQKTASALIIDTKEDMSGVKNLTKALKRFWPLAQQDSLNFCQ